MSITVFRVISFGLRPKLFICARTFSTLDVVSWKQLLLSIASFFIISILNPFNIILQVITFGGGRFCEIPSTENINSHSLLKFLKSFNLDVVSSSVLIIVISGLTDDFCNWSRTANGSNVESVTSCLIKELIF